MIVGLYGDSRAGKDTVSQILVEDFQFEWRSFAAPLREILLMINPPVGNNTDGYDFTLKEAVENYGWDWVKKQYPYIVDMMIALGQGVRDLIHEDAWTWNVFTEPLPKKMVISDVRQPNEFDAIKGAGGEVWRIIRPGTKRRGMDGLLDSRHFHVTIYNDGNHDNLRRIIHREVEDALQNRWA